MNFPNYLLTLIANIIPLWSENIFCMISILFNIYWGLFYDLTYGLSWKMLHVYLMRIYILLLLDGILYRGLLDYSVYSVVQIYFLTDLFPSCSIHFVSVLKRIFQIRVFKSPTFIVELSVSSFSSIIFCFMPFWALLLGAPSYCFMLLFKESLLGPDKFLSYYTSFFNSLSLDLVQWDCTWASIQRSVTGFILELAYNWFSLSIKWGL